MPLRIHFQERLDEIRTEVIRMGTEANDMVRMAVEATVNNDAALAEQVVAADDRVDHFERSVLNKAMVAVMQEQPVAADLRFLIATLGIVGEIEKAGDDAVKLARRSMKFRGQFPMELRAALLEIGEQVRQSFASAVRLFASYSTELATQIIQGDEKIDHAYSEARHRVFDLIRAAPESTRTFVRTIDVFHALEHVADHAVAIAVRMSMLYDQHPLAEPEGDA